MRPRHTYRGSRYKDNPDYPPPTVAEQQQWNIGAPDARRISTPAVSRGKYFPHQGDKERARRRND